eukprot:357535-Rhodomonas_salina.2
MASTKFNSLSAFSEQQRRASNTFAHSIAMLKACDSPAKQKALIETVSKDTQTHSMPISTPVEFSAPTQTVSSAHAKPEKRKPSMLLLELEKAKALLASYVVLAHCNARPNACESPAHQTVFESASNNAQSCSMSISMPSAFSISNQALSESQADAIIPGERRSLMLMQGLVDSFSISHFGRSQPYP